VLSETLHIQIRHQASGSNRYGSDPELGEAVPPEVGLSSEVDEDRDYDRHFSSVPLLPQGYFSLDHLDRLEHRQVLLLGGLQSRCCRLFFG